MVLAAVVATSSVAESRSLAGLLDDVITRRGLERLNPSVAFVPILTRLAIRSADFPTTSTTPDFFYFFDFATGALVRNDRALGSEFLEEPDTVGRGTLELAASGFVSDAGRLNGDSLTGDVSRFSLVVPSPVSGFTRLPIVLRFREFNLRTSGVLFSSTYGVTDKWDINVLAPLLETSLNVEGSREATIAGQIFPIEEIAIKESRLGIGDVLLRTKYHLGTALSNDVAVGLTLRLPTGSKNDFQGLGDWIIVPFLAVGRNVGRHNLHFNLGVETNTDVLERTRVRYGLGASVYLAERVSALVDVFGGSGISAEDFSAGTFAVTSVRRRMLVSREIGFPATAPRTDIVDGAVGVKVKIAGALTGFASVILPITSDGFRADVVPIGGLEATF
jgi:hypothetical protein